jgi:hypothetical protein
MMLALLVTLSPCHLVTLSSSRAEPLPDPLPLKRVQIPADRAPAEVQRSAPKRWVQMPRAEFEELVQRAAQGADAARKQPQLVEARYRARLVDNALVGSGQWKVLHPGPGNAVLPLPSLNLALRQPRFENKDALLADFDGKTLGLLLEQPGEHSVALEWSARGELKGAGLDFDLEVPSCPVATLELDLPADRVVTISSDGCLLSGPLQAEAADHRLWRVGFAGRSSVHFTLRTADQHGPQGGLLVGLLQTRQRLAPDGLEADFEFDVKALPQGQRELRVELDAVLRPYDVVARNLESWQVDEPDPSPAGALSGHAMLTVRLREPFQGGSLLVRCRARLGRAGAVVAWNCPGARVVGAVPRGEMLVLRVPPEVQLQNWHAGSFRLTGAETEPDGVQVLTLAGGGLEAEGTPRRPTARLAVSGSEVRARQLTWWEVGPPRPAGSPAAAGDTRKTALTTQIHYEAVRGQVFQLAVALPPGWDVERVQLTPPDALRNWSPRVEKGRSVLLVELQRPLAPPPAGKDEPGHNSAATVHLTVGLRPSPAARPAEPRPGPEQSYPFPDPAPLEVRAREGGLAIEFDETLYEGRVTTAARPSAPDEEGPWGRQIPDYYYPFRGQPVAGTLHLKTRQPRLRARATSEVFLAAGGAGVTTHLLLQPDLGNPEAVDLYVSAPGTTHWEWKAASGSNSVKAFERLPAAEAAPLLATLAVTGPLQAACLAAVPALPGERWRLTLARPLRDPLLLEGGCEFPPGAAQPGEVRLEVPLLAVVGSERMEGEARLYTARAKQVQVTAAGLRESSGPAAAGGRTNSSPWRVFRYNAPPMSLTLHGRLPKEEEGPAPVIDHARLTTCAGVNGPALYHYRFRVWNWKQRALPLRLPPGAKPLALRVDGRWVTDLPAPAEGPGGDGVLVELPVPGGTALHRYEVVYAVDLPAWGFWTRLQAQEPILPVPEPPLDARRIWLLAPGVAPLFDGVCERLPGPDMGSTPLAALLSPGRNLGPLLRLVAPDDAPEVRRQRLTEAAFAMPREEAGQSLSFGDALDRLACDALQEQAVVLDIEALREGGIGPLTPLAPAAGPFWEGLGLVHVPCRAAPLLTTRRQWESWQTAEAADLIPAAVDEAVTAAARFGHDGSGRFRTVAAWLRAGELADALPDGPDPRYHALTSARLGPDWTAWESLAGSHADDGVLLIRRDGVTALGVLLALVLAAAFFRLLPRSPARSAGEGPTQPRSTGEGAPRARFGVVGRHAGRLPLLLVWLTAAGLGVLWLPASLADLAWWPLLTALAGGLAYYLWAVAHDSRQPPAAARMPAKSGSSNRPAAVAGAGAVVALVLLLPLGTAAAPEPVTVFLLPGPADAPDKETALVPEELVDHLKAMAGRGRPILRGPVLVSAGYKGQVKGAGAEAFAQFEAVFQVHSFTPEAAPLTLPLGAVQVEGALVDGVRVLPTLPGGAAGPGYSVRLEGAGPHVVVVSFRVPVQGAGGDCDLQFSVPRLAQNRLELTVPEDARYLQALVKQGSKKLDEDGRHLEVELGRVAAPLHFRWRQEGARAGAPSVGVRELYLWDLGVSASTLRAVLQYAISQGAVTQLVIDLPPQTEVQSLEVGGPTADVTRPRLKVWQVTGTEPRRQILVVFQAPVTGNVQVQLELAPRRPFGLRSFILPLPTPQNAQAAEGLLAYHLEGLKAEVSPGSLGVKGIEPDEFVRQWRTARTGEPSPLAYACRFGRKPDPPSLMVKLDVPSPQIEAGQDVAWRIGPQHADLHAELQLSAPDGDLVVAEWLVPEGVTVARVTGPNVRSWSRSGPRVQVWLQRSVAAAELQLSGWWLPPAGVARLTHFDLPPLAPVAAAVTTHVRLTAAPGLTLEPGKLHNLWRPPDPRPVTTGRELAWLTQQPEYGGDILVRADGAGVDVQVLTLADIRDRQLTFTARLDCQVRDSGLRTLTVVLRHWEGDPVRLEGPEVARVRERGREPGKRVWTVDLNPNFGGRCQLTLTGALPLEAVAGNERMPEVSVEESETEAPGLRSRRSQRWVAVASPDLQAEGPQGLAVVKDVETALRPWPAEAQRLRASAGRVWKVTAGDWDLVLVPRRRPSETALVQLFLTEQAAAVVDGRHWAHQTTFWLYHEANADLHLVLPAGAAPQAVTVDDAPVTPLPSDPQTNGFWLPLSAGAGPRCVRLRWSFADGAESLERPNLEPCRLESGAGGPLVWSVAVPAGYRATGGLQGDGAPRAASAASLDVRRAEAQLRISEVLSRRGRGEAASPPLVAAQRRFYHYCRLAECELATQGAGTDLGPGGQELSEWLQQLEDDNQQLARAHGFEALQTEAHRQARAAPPVDEVGATTLVPGAALPERGTPLLWQGESDVGPRLALKAVATQRQMQSLGGSLLLLVLVFATLGVASSPRLLPRVYALWPEELVALGGLGWLAGGLNVVVLFLVVLGVCGRLLSLGWWTLALLHRPAPQPAPRTGSSGGS